MKMYVLLAMATALALYSCASAETIALKSGNASVGQADPMITVRGAAVTVRGASYPAAPSVPSQQAVVVNPFFMWLAAPAGSKWVSCVGNTFAPPGGYIYQVRFTLPENYASPMLSLQALSDNGGEVVLNGHGIPSNGPNGYTGFSWRETYLYGDPVGFSAGENLLEFHVINGSDSAPPTNPTGIAF